MKRSPTVASSNKKHNSNISKTLVSRITAPFVSRQRSPVELEIRLDEPFRQYFCGDTVKGAVRLLTTRASRITHLVIRLHGFVKVVNNVRLPGETIPYDENLLTSMRRRKGIEYFGNGFARLFEDEHILCGDGRVDSEYEFRFELDLPKKGIPSSIDFEHGTISYLLTATLTRPTTISPTLTIHHKLNVTGTIDIAHLKPPVPRVVALKAPGKQKKGKKDAKRKSPTVPNGKASKSSSLDENSVNGLSAQSPQESDFPPQSPAPSTISSASTGESTVSNHNESQNVPIREAAGGPEQYAVAIPPEEITTAKTELLQGGCLPGDTLQLRISVDHRKPVKAMQGIIITVFRQGRIDTHPALPLGLVERGGKSQYEDYYPKSRTGLGGLSLTSAGSSRVFRQDLAQTIMPLIIDPQTLGANIKTSIQMPDHVFPTITCVPGSMISFKYYIEIVIDLRGKPAGQDRFLPHLSITNLPQHSYGDPKISKKNNGDGISYSATPGFNCLITDQIRRTKDVVFTTTEVIVGTKDSGRSRGKRRKSSIIESDRNETAQHVRPNSDHRTFEAASLSSDQQTLIQEERPPQQNLTDSSRQGLQTPVFPIPDLDEPHDEKTQLRRAEERLLPSSPPQDDEPPATSIAPIAPFAHDEVDFVHRYGFQASTATSYERPNYESRAEDRRLFRSQNSADNQNPSPVHETGPQDGPQDLTSPQLHAQLSVNDENHNSNGKPLTCSQTPDLDTPSPEADSANVCHSSLPVRPMEGDNDEQLQRQQQEAQASSPEDAPVDENEAFPRSTASQPQYPAASASALDEIELARNHNDHNYEDLPVYRR